MTTREKLKKMLTDNGMADGQADAVLKEAIPRIEASMAGYKITWNEPADGYPETVFNALWLHLCETAREWIAENAPRAWFRPIFD